MLDDTTIRLLHGAEEVDAAAALSLGAHERLRRELPFLPPRTREDLACRIQWVVEHGAVVGSFAAGHLRAFLGAFLLDDFRNAGPGTYGPDWCYGTAPGVDRADAWRRLYRDLAPALVRLGARIHAFSLYASERAAVHAAALTGFGRIVADAARDVAGLRADLSHTHVARPAAACRWRVERATRADAAALAGLESELRRHVGAAPVFMPAPRGRSAADWAAWLANPGRVALLARSDAGPVGYIRAQEPQIDVSYAVHDAGTLAINGLLVQRTWRRAGLGRELLNALANLGQEGGYRMLSVDWETANLEAHRFWSRWFRPVSWSCERRI